LDEATGWCLGCARTGDEIADWGSDAEAWRARIWSEIPGRLAQLGVACHRLPWSTDDIQTFVERTLADGRGTWVMGVVGAVAEFVPAAGETIELHAVGSTLRAKTRNGALSMRIDDDVRALTCDPPGLNTPPRVILAVKRARGRLRVAHGVQDLGEDVGALLPDVGTQLFDLGLGRKDARFCVRVAPGPSRAVLDKAAGVPFAQALPRIAGPLVAESPTRVVESALGRIEVQGQIPPPDARSPDGPHTHLMPDHLASGRALPLGMDLPRAYVPGAIFYPSR